MNDWFDPLAGAHHALATDRLGDAEAICRTMLYVEATRAGALELLSIIRVKEGRLEDAERFIRGATGAEPERPRYWCTYGEILCAAGRLEEGVICFDRALSLDPHNRDALLRRADALRLLTRYRDALELCDTALSLYPEDADVLHTSGRILSDMGRWTEAIGMFERAVAAAVYFPWALYHCGVAFSALGRHADAMACFDKVLATDPTHVMAWVSRGKLLNLARDHESALTSYDRALELSPTAREAVVGRALTRLLLTDHPNALAECRTLASAYYRMGCHREAIEEFRHALALNPSDEGALNGMMTAALQSCDWGAAASAERSMETLAQTDAGVVHPSTFLALAPSHEAQLNCAVTFASRQWPEPAVTPMVRNTSGRPHARLRLAYIAHDWRWIGHDVIDVLERHDRQRCEVIAVTRSGGHDDLVDARLQRACDELLDVQRLSDEEAAACLLERGVNIVIDLGGHSANSTLGILAKRPAPIQVSYLGFPATTGAPFMDYLIADPMALPIEESQRYSEKIVHVPCAYHVGDPDTSQSGTTRIAEQLPDDRFVFCCFGPSFKIRRALFEVWMRLLATIDGSVLWLLAHNDSVVRNLRREAQSRNIDPDRLVFFRQERLRRQRARFVCADLFLDTWPYSSPVALSHALGAGVPGVTCLDASFAGRGGGSVLHAAGLPELVAPSLRAYEKTARNLAAKPAFLREIRRKLTSHYNTHLLFDVDRCRHHLETAYARMWSRFMCGEPPSNFAVS